MAHKKNKVMYLALSLFLVWACEESPKDDTPWVDLFDGSTLDGWTQKGAQPIMKSKRMLLLGLRSMIPPIPF